MAQENTNPAHPEILDPAHQQLRAGTWNLLGNLLAGAPTADVLALLQRVEAGVEPGGEAGAENDAADGLAAAWSALRQAARQAQAQATDLRAEYQDVFVGVGGGELTPYASWYLTGSLMERPLVLLRQDLQSLGIERKAGVSEPEDHAAALCEIMALVIADPDVSFQWQRDFYQRHIDPWMGRFFKELQEAESADFYRPVGCLGERFVRLEQYYFSMLA